MNNNYDISLYNLLILQSVFGAGSHKAFEIYKILKGNQLLSSSFGEVNFPDKIAKKDAERLVKFDCEKIRKIFKDCRDNNIKMLSIEDSAYPERLRNISEPPLVLYIKGELPNIDELPVISIVGPRNVTEFGKKAAFSLGRRLAKAGMLIVSGGAVGSDTAAHKGALSCGGKTIAVLGCGICYDYLPENRKLRTAIAQSCCLISEHPPYAPTTKFSFPIRNRLMSGLSLGTIIVEANEKSGALITAKHAYEQGRDVFVIPGNPTDQHYKGSNKLLRDGALPLLDASDVFSQYIMQYAQYLDLEKAFEEKETSQKEKKSVKKLPIGLSKTAEMVYNNLNKQIFTADDLLHLGIADDNLISVLTELEMENVIEALPGGTYKIIN